MFSIRRRKSLTSLERLKEGLRNLDKHVRNLRSFGQTVIVAFNKFASDTDEEMELLREHCEQLGVGFAINNAFSEGGEGAVDMARLVVDTIENNPSEPLRYTYKEEDNIQQKIEKVATNIYGASVITYSSIARNRTVCKKRKEKHTGLYIQSSPSFHIHFIGKDGDLFLSA